jgi:hypothetical protein
VVVAFSAGCAGDRCLNASWGACDRLSVQGIGGSSSPWKFTRPGFFPSPVHHLLDEMPCTRVMSTGSASPSSLDACEVVHPLHASISSTMEELPPDPPPPPLIHHLPPHTLTNVAPKCNYSLHHPSVPCHLCHRPTSLPLPIILFEVRRRLQAPTLDVHSYCHILLGTTEDQVGAYTVQPWELTQFNHGTSFSTTHLYKSSGMFYLRNPQFLNQ